MVPESPECFPGNIHKLEEDADRARRRLPAQALYYAPRQATKEVEEQYGVEYSALPALLKSSDIVSLHVPLTDTTRNMIGVRVSFELSLGCSSGSDRGS